jgi:hypothetical protein
MYMIPDLPKDDDGRMWLVAKMHLRPSGTEVIAFTEAITHFNHMPLFMTGPTCHIS